MKRQSFGRVSILALVFVVTCLATLVTTTQAMASNKKDVIDLGDAQKSILYDTDLPQRIQIYRIYNPTTGEHFYTKDEEEKDIDVAAGWVDEGVGWWISPLVSKNPVYRFYNTYVGDHHYTPDADERDMLKEAGWTYEGLTWYETEEGEVDRIPVYRAYNHYEISWNHVYTKDEKEYNNLVNVGWNDEKVAWYAFDKLQTDISDANVSFPTKLTYNGGEQKQYVDVRLGSKTLTEGTDYTTQGSVNKDAGTYTITITGNSNAGYVGEIKRTYTIEKKVINVSSIIVNDKEYDQTTDANLDRISSDGVCGDDDVDVDLIAQFEDAAVGNNKTVVVASIELVGQDIANYALDEDALPKTTANINPKTLTIRGLSFEDKVYDRTDTVTMVGGGATLDAGLPGEDVSLEDINARFEDRNVGENKKVIVDEFKLKGDDAANYVVVAESDSFTATINPKPITIQELSFKERAYEEGNTDAELDTSTNKFSDNAIIEGDEVVVAEATYSYADDNAGNDKEVMSTEAPALGGRDKDNYTVTSYPKPLKGTVLAVVKYNTNCETQKEEEHVKVGTHLTKDESGLSRTGLKIENWYTDERCSDDEDHRWDFSSDAVEENVMTLSANWVPDEDAGRYWISPSMNIASGTLEQSTVESNENYVKEEWNVKKSYAEIKDDLDVLKNKNKYSDDEYNKVKEEYESFLQNDDYHLYTKYTGNTATLDGEKDASETGQNGYMEARVIQVGEHDGDGTGLTFHATHLLPQASSMRDSQVNTNGWSASTPRKALDGSTITFTYNYYRVESDAWNDQGSGTFDKINDTFNSVFLNDLASITKKYNKGNKASRNSAETDVKNKIWLLSYTEVDSVHSEVGSQAWPRAGVEGSTYQWFSAHSVDLQRGNKLLGLTTRNGKIPRNYFYNDGAYIFWWLRTPNVNNATQYLYTNSDGLKGSYGAAYNSMGIAPAFAM